MKKTVIFFIIIIMLCTLLSCGGSDSYEGWLSETELETYGLNGLAPAGDTLAMEDESRMFSDISEEKYLEYAWEVYSVICRNNGSAYSANFSVDNTIVSFKLFSPSDIQQLGETAVSESVCMVSLFYRTKENRLIHTMLIYYPEADRDIPARSLKISFTDQTVSYGDKPFTE